GRFLSLSKACGKDPYPSLSQGHFPKVSVCERPRPLSSDGSITTGYYYNSSISPRGFDSAQPPPLARESIGSPKADSLSKNLCAFSVSPCLCGKAPRAYA